jgi:hypothetical protein
MTEAVKAADPARFSDIAGSWPGSRSTDSAVCLRRVQAGQHGRQGGNDDRDAEYVHELH